VISSEPDFDFGCPPLYSTDNSPDVILHPCSRNTKTKSQLRPPAPSRFSFAMYWLPPPSRRMKLFLLRVSWSPFREARPIQGSLIRPRLPTWLKYTLCGSTTGYSHEVRSTSSLNTSTMRISLVMRSLTRRFGSSKYTKPRRKKPKTALAGWLVGQPSFQLPSVPTPSFPTRKLYRVLL